MDVEEEGQVVVSVRVLVVHQNALLEVLHCVLIITNLEVCKTEIVLQLRIVVIDPLCLLKRCNGKHILTLLVHGDAIVEEGLPAACVILLEVLFGCDCKALPV